MAHPLTNKSTLVSDEPKATKTEASKYVVYNPKDVEKAKKLVPLMVPFLDEFRWMTNPKGSAYQEAYQTLEFIAERGQIADPTPETLKKVEDSILVLANAYLRRMDKPPMNPAIAHLFPKPKKPQSPESEANDVTSLAMRTVLEVIQLRKVAPLPRTLETSFDALVEIHLQGGMTGASQSRLAKTTEHVQYLRNWMGSVSKKPEAVEPPMAIPSVKVGMQHFHEVTAASGDEGNGPVRIVGFARDYNFACQFAKGKGVFGGNATVMSVSREIVEMPDGSTYFLGKRVEFEDDLATEKKRLLDSIRNKLTPEELKAFNLLTNQGK